ncbi:MAG: hypothetical protein M3R17_05230 [Bacteroidota bacterium]|nr:hypothetical protein [Bacteroidota bacterium]
MKSILLKFALLSLLFSYSCSSSNDAGNDEDAVITETETKAFSMLIGKWQVDSAGFINDGIQKPMNAPLADAFWEFRIRTLNAKELVLVPTITNTREMKMETITRLKRLN